MTTNQIHFCLGLLDATQSNRENRLRRDLARVVRELRHARRVLLNFGPSAVLVFGAVCSAALLFQGAHVNTMILVGYEAMMLTVTGVAIAMLVTSIRSRTQRTEMYHLIRQGLTYLRNFERAYAKHRLAAERTFQAASAFRVAYEAPGYLLFVDSHEPIEIDDTTVVQSLLATERFVEPTILEQAAIEVPAVSLPPTRRDGMRRIHPSLLT